MPEAQLAHFDAQHIEAARARVAEVAWRTPLVPAGRNEDGRVYLKLECLQRTGSFKVRGAWNRMAGSTPSERRQGFTTVSAGNHGQAVAWCAQRLDAPCTIWVPESAVAGKVAAIEDLGARIERRPHADIMDSLTNGAFARDHPVFVHPFGDPAVIAGQGTVGLEIVEDLPEVATVLVPIGGGGLATGVATAVKARRPNVRVFGVQAEQAAPYAASWRSGRPERLSSPTTIADGIGASIAFDYMWPLLRSRLDGILTVSEESMKAAMQYLARECHVVAEAAGAASLAAARAHTDLKGPVVCVVSGGNVDARLLARTLG